MKPRLLSLIVLFAVYMPLQAEQFRFIHTAGDQYRIVTSVEEDVFINGIYSHSADILNRVAVEVLDAQGGSGHIRAVFQVSERASGVATAYQWSEEYVSEFWRTSLGFYDIDNQYIMPTVRHVPAFPERNLSPGDRWTAEAEEVHDFTANFLMTEPLRFPVMVSYIYEKDEEVNGQVMAVISIQYSVFHRTGHPLTGLAQDLKPVRISGISNQLFYWNKSLGLPHAYNEEFDIVLELASGDTVEYTGAAEGMLYPSEVMNRTKVAEEIKETLKDRGIEDVDVSEVEEGVTLRLKNIQFLPDSAELLPEEKQKLDTVAEILRQYPDRDILITGHTALASTEEARQRFSEVRARAVADYLIGRGCRTDEQVVTRGMGARQPLADNSTEDGRRQNRRVEITILEN